MNGADHTSRAAIAFRNACADVQALIEDSTEGTIPDSEVLSRLLDQLETGRAAAECALDAFLTDQRERSRRKDALFEVRALREEVAEIAQTLDGLADIVARLDRIERLVVIRRRRG